MISFLNWLSQAIGLPYKDLVLTIIPVILTLFTFFMGYVINGFLKKRDELKQKEIVLKILKLNYQSLIKSIETEIDWFNHSKAKFTNYSSVFSFYPTISYPSLKIFEEIGYTSSYESIFRKKHLNNEKIEAFYFLYDTIFILNNINLPEAFDKNIDEILKIRKTVTDLSVGLFYTVRRLTDNIYALGNHDEQCGRLAEKLLRDFKTGIEELDVDDILIRFFEFEKKYSENFTIYEEYYTNELDRAFYEDYVFINEKHTDFLQLISDCQEFNERKANDYSQIVDKLKANETIIFN